MQCDQCGPLEYVWMDGYAFGDTLLEGVMFRVVFDAAKKVTSVEVDPKDADYFADLNTKKWLKAAKQHAAQEDTMTCPRCGTDVDGPGA